MSVNEVLDAVRALTPEERAQVRELIDSLPSTPAATEERLKRRLHVAGLLSEIEPPVRSARPRRPPIVVKGEPVSETIIAERG